MGHSLTRKDLQNSASLVLSDTLKPPPLFFLKEPLQFSLPSKCLALQMLSLWIILLLFFWNIKAFFPPPASPKVSPFSAQRLTNCSLIQLLPPQPSPSSFACSCLLVLCCTLFFIGLWGCCGLNICVFSNSHFVTLLPTVMVLESGALGMWWGWSPHE